MEGVVHHVCIEGDPAEVLEAGRFVEIDGVAGFVDVEDLAVGAGPQRHARTGVELHFALEPFARNINRPELVVTNLLGLDQDVPVLAVGAEREAHVSALLRRTDRKEIDALSAEIDAAEDEQWPLLHRIVHGEERREEAGLVVGLVHRGHVEAAESRFVGQRQIPRVDLLQAGRVEDQDFIAEDIEELSIRRELEVQIIVGRLRIGRPGKRLDDLVLLQVVLEKGRRTNLEPVDQLPRLARDEDHEAILWIDVERQRADVCVSVAEREGVERLPARHVDHFEVLLIRALDIQARGVAREVHRPRHARLQRDVRGQFLGRLVDDRDAPGVGCEIDGPRAARQLRRSWPVASGRSIDADGQRRGEQGARGHGQRQGLHDGRESTIAALCVAGSPALRVGFGLAKFLSHQQFRPGFNRVIRQNRSNLRPVKVTRTSGPGGRAQPSSDAQP